MPTALVTDLTSFFFGAGAFLATAFLAGAFFLGAAFFAAAFLAGAFFDDVFFLLSLMAKTIAHGYVVQGKTTLFVYPDSGDY